MYTGYTYAVAITSLITNMAPIFVVVISAILCKEKVLSKQILCIAFVLIGVFLVSGVFEGAIIADINAFIYGSLSMLCLCFNILLNKRMNGVDPLDRTVIQMFLSFIINTIDVTFNAQIPASINTISILLIIVHCNYWMFRSCGCDCSWCIDTI